MGQESKKPSQGGLLAVVVFFLVAFASLVISQILGLTSDGGRAAEAIWAIFILTTSGGAAITAILILTYLHNLHANSASVVEDLRQLKSGQTQNEAMLTQISENLLLSDAVKSVAFRENDRAVLIEAIQQDISKELWQSANVLIDELDDRFGCREEAQHLRQETQSRRNATIQDKIEAAIKQINSLWMIHNYEEAEVEIERLLQLFPDNEKVLALRGQTEKHRVEHKKVLLDRWEKAVHNNDIDQGVDILKLLDKYLSPSEASQMAESARDVFRAKLHNMGVQFSLFVTGKKWNKALKIGRQIIDEYPNSRMAQEVREKLEVLEERAQEQPV